MKIAVVTGASSGIGREFVRQIEHFYKDLDEIWVIARRKDRLEKLDQETMLSLRIFSGDLLKKQIYRDYDDALKKFSPDVRMLVNAAGFGKSGTFLDIAASGKRIQTDMADLNCRSLTRMLQLTIPYMSRGGRILNIASAAAFCPQPFFAVYAATKAYVLSLSRSLRAELKPLGIIVTAVCPGPVDTEFFEISGSLRGPLKKLTLAKPSRVVKRALTDSRRRRGLSVYGAAMKTAYLGTKLLPHRLIIRVEELFKG
nr:SDR family NAD(P)-dependent oxidoreductase [uncultured Mediterraneibacter sp.]